MTTIIIVVIVLDFLLILVSAEFAQTRLFSVLLVRLPDENDAREDENDENEEGPLEVFRHDDEAEDAVSCALNELVVAVEAELAHVSVAAQAVEQINVPEDALEPEVESADVLFRGHEVRHEEVRVEHREARRERCAAHVDLVLHAVVLPLQ